MCRKPRQDNSKHLALPCLHVQYCNCHEWGYKPILTITPSCFFRPVQRKDVFAKSSCLCVCLHCRPEGVVTDTFLRNTFSSGLKLGAKLHQHLDLPVLKGSEKSNYITHKHRNGEKQQIKQQIQRGGRKAPWLIRTCILPQSFRFQVSVKYCLQ